MQNDAFDIFIEIPKTKCVGMRRIQTQTRKWHLDLDEFLSAVVSRSGLYTYADKSC